MRHFGIIVLFLGLFGCAKVNNPTSEQVKGVWEHTNYLYVRLQLDTEGNGFAVVPTDEGDSYILEIDSFVSNESFFTVSVKELAESDSEKSIFKGVLYQDGALCFTEIDEGEVGDETICFNKANRVDQSRGKAMDILENLNNKKPNGTSALDAFSTRPLAGR